MDSKRRIYLASPLFNENERAFNLRLKVKLSEDFDVFLPQEDGLLLTNLVENGIEKSIAVKSVYDADISAMRKSDVIIAVLDGATIDEGVAFELGYCRALNKVCIGLQTDVRRQLPTGNNPMIDNSCLHVFNNIETLCTWLKNNMSAL